MEASLLDLIEKAKIHPDRDLQRENTTLQEAAQALGKLNLPPGYEARMIDPARVRGILSFKPLVRVGIFRVGEKPRSGIPETETVCDVLPTGNGRYRIAGKEIPSDLKHAFNGLALK